MKLNEILVGNDEKKNPKPECQTVINTMEIKQIKGEGLVGGGHAEEVEF